MTSVERALDLPVPPARAWQAWVRDIHHWWTKPYYNDGKLVTGLSFEQRLGGVFVENWGEEAGFLVGRIVEWLPPQRLSYTWMEAGWRGAETLVRLTFSPIPSGTRLALVHEGFERLAEPEKLRQGYQFGVNELTERFLQYLQGQEASLKR